MTLSHDSEAELHRRSRLRLAVVVGVLALGAALSTLSALAYEGGSWLVPLLLWAGVACLAMAWRSVPRTTADAGPRRASATWVVLGVLLYVVAPLLVSRLG